VFEWEIREKRWEACLVYVYYLYMCVNIFCSEDASHVFLWKRDFNTKVCVDVQSWFQHFFHGAIVPWLLNTYFFCCQAPGLFFLNMREGYHAHGSMFYVLVFFHPDENVFTLMKTDKREEDEKGIHQGTCPSSSGGPACWFLSCFGVDGSKYGSRHKGITRLFTDFFFLLNLIQRENGDWDYFAEV
jgi:hypothetical protein